MTERPGRLVLHAMGTEVTIDGPDALQMRQELVRLEAILTRFRESPVTRLNRAGRLRHPDPVLLGALSWAVEACRLSGGLVTPLVGCSMDWHGYRESWSEGVDWQVPEGEPPAIANCGQLEVSEAGIVLPDGAAIDLGGTAKSWIVERVAAGHQDVVIDAGGDVLIDSSKPHDVNLLGGAEDWHLEFPPGRWAVATSSVARRAWRGGHHLLDVRTGRPVKSRWVQATVLARSLKLAEVATKLLLMDAPIPDSLQVEGAWVVDETGTLVEHQMGEPHGTQRDLVPAG